jgi:hypothetical protein
MSDRTGTGGENLRAPPESISTDALIRRHVENARAQLAEARERLKAARRRVVQLEDAVANWELLARSARATCTSDAAREESGANA